MLHRLTSTISKTFSVLLIASRIGQWNKTGCLSASALLLPLPLLLLLLPPVTTRENGRGIPAKVQLQFSLRCSSERLTTIRALVSNLQAVTGRVDIEGIFQGVTTVTGIIVASAIRVAVRGASRWAMRPRIVGARGLQIRISSNSKHHRISNRATRDVFIVALKVTSKDTALS